MVQPSKGSASGRTRMLKGRKAASVSCSIKKFSIGSTVVLAPQSRCRGEVLRFSGRHGTVAEIRGNGYVVAVRDGKKTKHVTITPAHLRPAI